MENTRKLPKLPELLKNNKKLRIGKRMKTLNTLWYFEDMSGQIMWLNSLFPNDSLIHV